MWLAFPSLFDFSDRDGKEPEAFKTQDHIFYDQRMFDIARNEGDDVSFWAGAKDKSEKR